MAHVRKSTIICTHCKRKISLGDMKDGVFVPNARYVINGDKIYCDNACENKLTEIAKESPKQVVKRQDRRVKVDNRPISKKTTKQKKLERKRHKEAKQAKGKLISIYSCEDCGDDSYIQPYNWECGCGGEIVSGKTRVYF